MDDSVAAPTHVSAPDREAPVGCVVLVEGVSDRIALEAVAARRGVDLAERGVSIVAVGGVHAIGRHLDRLVADDTGRPVFGLCDADKEDVVRRALQHVGHDRPRDRRAMERLGFFVCDRDLEDELIRTAGRETIEAVLDATGDLPAFRTLQRQPAWRGRAFEEQMHRWLRAGARRRTRYARFLVEHLDPGSIPRPLDALVSLASAA